MTTRSNFARETPLTDPDDRRKLAGFLALALAVSMAAVLLQVAFVVLRPSEVRAPELLRDGSGVSYFIREARP